MGLGKTLSIVGLVASTIETARDFGRQPIRQKDEDDDDSSSDDSDSDLDASHFSGAVFGMPDGDQDDDEPESGNKRKRKRKETKFKASKIAKLERHARLERLEKRSRATLLVCPLSTVTNWEDQISEHWNGGVYVVGGSSKKEEDTKPSTSKGKKGDANGKKAEAACKRGENKPYKKGDLTVYVYHGNSRKNDISFLANFDIVITTFSVLQTEYSKQLKTCEGKTRYASTSNGAAGSDGSNDDDAMEVDEEVDDQKAGGETAKNGGNQGAGRRGKGEPDLFGRKTAKETTSPLQQIEWFRIVLDEAQ